MSHDDVTEMPMRRLERFPRKIGLLAGLLLLVGAVAWIVGLVADAERAWRAYLFNWLYWTALAQGAVMFVGALVITTARWSLPIRRIALSPVAFLPLAFLLMLPLFFVGEQIFPWAADPSLMQEGKEVWLNMPLLAARNILFFGALVFVSLLFAYWALRPDAALAREASGFSGLSRLYGRMTRGWRHQEAEEARSHRKLAKLAPILGMLYAFTLGLFSWDFIMSLEPHWWSTLLGPYYFMGAFLGGVALTAVLAVTYRRALGLHEWIRPAHFHDLGKLTFAFCIFWIYLFWAQYIVIWYGKLPEEQGFVIHRMSEPFGAVAFVAFLGLFLVPFFGLLGVAPKKKPAWLTTFCGIILGSLWLERYVLTYPSWYTDVGTLPFGFAEIGAGFLFAGLFIASLAFFGTRFPILQVWQHPSDPHPDILDEPKRRHVTMPSDASG